MCMCVCHSLPSQTPPPHTHTHTPQITRSVFGEPKTIELKDKGEHTPVTKDTRREYIYLYMRYFLVDSIQEQFKAFQNGFKRVCAGKILVSHICCTSIVNLKTLDRVLFGKLHMITAILTLRGGQLKIASYSS